MEDQGEDTMNLDLNLGPVAPVSPALEPGSGSGPSSSELRRERMDDRLAELIQEILRDMLIRRGGHDIPRSEPGSGQSSGDPMNQGTREAIRFLRNRSRRWRWRQAQIPSEATNASIGLTVYSSDNGSQIHAPSGAANVSTGLMVDSSDSGLQTPAPSRVMNVSTGLIVDSTDGVSLDQVFTVVRNASMGLTIDSSDIGGHAGQGSAISEQRSVEKTYLNQLEDEAIEKNEVIEKGNGNEESFFDCNICLVLSREPVVTCCGHLFCWPCIYRWLHIHSDAKECPVCKGEVTLKNLTPIYGRGESTRDLEEDLGFPIPMRPTARRVESLRQAIQRSASSFPMDEMIRRLGSRFDLSRDLFHQDLDNARNTLERGPSVLNRILTSRGLRREQNLVLPPEDLVDLTPERVARPEVTEHHRLPSLIFRRSQLHRGSLASSVSSGERFIEAYNHGPQLPARSQEPRPAVEDRDSFSSIAAVIHGESQTIDTAVEIDSMVSLSASSSRRRNDISRISDMDSGDSRALRRRRLN